MTQEDIEKGEKCNAETCPMALAIKREFPESDAVYVRRRKVVIENGHSLKVYRAGSRNGIAQRFIDRFDNGDPVKPVRPFELRRV